MALSGGAFTISGGICLHGALVGSPLVNTLFLAVGSVLGSLVGTTGASVLLIRPLLRANERSRLREHVVVFFIFIVSKRRRVASTAASANPPLFLGFLRGVPFTWTRSASPRMAPSTGALLAIFALIDRVQFGRRAPTPARAPLDGRPSLSRPKPWGPSALVGRSTSCALGLVAVVSSSGLTASAISARATCAAAVQIAGTLGSRAVLQTTAARVHEVNRFSWAPIVEVAVVFVGVLWTMVPAMSFLASAAAHSASRSPAVLWASARSRASSTRPDLSDVASAAARAGVELAADGWGARCPDTARPAHPIAALLTPSRGKPTRNVR